MLLLPNWPPCLCIVFRQKCAETCLEGAKLCAFPFHFSFGSTLDPDRTFLQFFVHFRTCTNANYWKEKKKAKPSLPLKFRLWFGKLEIFFTIILSLFITICYEGGQTLMYWNAWEYLHNLKIPSASSKNFPSRNKADSAPHACPRKQSAIQLM